MTEVAIAVPRRADGGHRDRLWDYSRGVWAEMFPGWPICEGVHEASEGPFNRSKAVNRAAELVEWDALLVIDADVLPDPAGVERAVEVALEETRAAAGFRRRRNLSRRGTELVMGGYRGSWERYVQSEHPLCRSGALAVSRELWNAVGGFDELFVGWGYEDTAFEIACETASGRPVWQADADLWHLWHPRSPEHNIRSPLFRANRKRLDRYAAAKGTMDSLLGILEEAGAAGTPLTQQAARPSKCIPRILHRTVPEASSLESEAWWQGAMNLTPGWEHVTHRDPLDVTEWPLTGLYWARCSSGAQKAGLIRLEALNRWGGVYIDSDVQLWRSLEPLLGLEGFAAWEDARVVPDAVMGFRPGHPALLPMIAEALAKLGEGAWESGPGVTTRNLPGRGDVLLLPPGSFYPYHYKEKHREGADHAAEQPWSFGAHHWRHSWKGS